MLLIGRGAHDADISQTEARELVRAAVSRVFPTGNVAALPPDGTRAHSRSGAVLGATAAALGDRLALVLPALGTHEPMTAAEIARLYPDAPAARFAAHDWRHGVVELGRLEGAFVERVSEGALRYDWPAQANRLLVEGGFSGIVSIGQVVPHEVAGMANHAKNLWVGAGGKEAIDKSHFLGAAYGMERMMGRADTPVRALFDEALRRFGSKLPPILWIQTVVGARPDGSLALRGLYASTDRECFDRAAALSRAVNLDLLDAPLRKVVCYLDPEEFRSTWLGNKAVYRTRMAIADSGELVVLAPGVRRFGEDLGIDALIRKYGYRSSAEVRALVEREPDLAGALSAAAHLIHGSSEGRFRITYAAGGLSRDEVEGVGYAWADYGEAAARYDPAQLRAGVNVLPDGEEIFFVPNPALGLWATKARFGA